ncbi:ATP-binding cassette subfamily B protein [Clostridium tetanomorphum]|uniref:ABC transporter ATP-binding protein n=1 Tax=Clostridium tetanomorphum TaxID=1553 RepID=A0A923J321_CLOTT|nr:ABC transporter ATP-binding protein [Clostridium tetanomorphum]KAJ51855.1 ABC transporter [Clostridium tetanomorphum DSM 665]MBC2399505.1 ABC transporter ATP-binding protein [Clostridium tetanomorphum]MBP1864142.1 ATP-binding cassette subfamily B protein [Clostridium tetanomorphum]NRS84555.1 ATP-binding cassette subfamily B protein [Clostridium tetanomorphum]NRZ97769.1 ATP-binding cassette subfamily B protein [Clostridium tetanomorphum]
MKAKKRLLEFLNGNKLLYLGAIFCIAIATFIGIIEPLVIKTTIDSVIGDKPIETSLFVEKLINRIGGRSVLVQNLWICSIALITLASIRGIFLFLKGALSAKASENIAKNIRERLYNHIQHLPYEYHIKNEKGELIQRCTSDIDTIRKFLSTQFVEMGRAIFILIFSISAMIALDKKMTVVAIGTVPFIFTFSFIFFSKIKNLFKQVDEAEAKMTTVLQENISGVRVVRAFGREKYEIEKYDKENENYTKLAYKLYVLLSNYWSISDFLCMIQIGAVLIFGIYFTVKRNITLGTLVVFMNYEGMLLWPVRQLGRILSDMGKMVVSINRIGEILDEKTETELCNEKMPQISGNIEFKEVYFYYEKNNPILKGISFNIKKGEKIAIIGSTGSGKSSLTYLLTRLYDYQQGSIKIDGIELRDINKKWIRKNIGLVLQEPFLFSRTIKENIKIANKEANEDKIIKAASEAAIHKVILEFEKGYDTLVGENGVTLSGGQRQRVAIARTLISNSPILIFDDSLSAVDTKTDKKIRKALKNRSKGVTTIIISHRIATIKDADKIIVMNKGEIAQIGVHEKLIKEEGLYKRIWQIQKNVREEDEKVS